MALWSALRKLSPTKDAIHGPYQLTDQLAGVHTVALSFPETGCESEEKQNTENENDKSYHRPILA
jgi:hypothetical protein